MIRGRESWSRLPIPAVWNDRVFLVTDWVITDGGSVELPKQVHELSKLIHKNAPPAAETQRAAAAAAMEGASVKGHVTPAAYGRMWGVWLLVLAGFFCCA